MLTAVALASGGDDLLDGPVDLRTLAGTVALLRMFLAGVKASAEVVPSHKTGPAEEPSRSMPTNGQLASASLTANEFAIDTLARGNGSAGYEAVRLDEGNARTPPARYGEAAVPGTPRFEESLTERRERFTPEGAPQEKPSEEHSPQAFVWDRTERVFLAVSNYADEASVQRTRFAEVMPQETTDAVAEPAEGDEGWYYPPSDELSSTRDLSTIVNRAREKLSSPVWLVAVVALLAIAIGGYTLLERHRAPVVPQSQTAQIDQARNPQELGAGVDRSAQEQEDLGKTPPQAAASSATPRSPERLLQRADRPPNVADGSRKLLARAERPRSAETLKAVTKSTEPKQKGVVSKVPKPLPGSGLVLSRGPVFVSQAEMDRRLVASRPPAYPSAARAQHLQGSVVLNAFVAKDGSVKRVDVVRGPAAFINSAVAAATWRRYKPVLVQGKPVEVKTEITINYPAS